MINVTELSVIMPIPPSYDESLLKRSCEAIDRQTIVHEIDVIFARDAANFSVVYNEALERAKGEYVIFHEYTNQWFPDGMERIRSYIEKQYPNIWGVFSTSWNVDAKGNHIVGTDPVDGMVAEQVTGRMEFTKERGNTVNSAAVILRRSALEKIKDRYGYVFDPRLKLHEDWDLYLRMLQMRGKIIFHEGEPVSNWFDNPNGRHHDPLFDAYKKMVYFRIASSRYD